MFIKTANAVGLDGIYAPGQALNGSGAQISTLINPIITNGLVLSGVVAFFVILFAGFNYISSAGDKNKLTQSTNMLTYGILGLAVVVSAYLITRIIGKSIGFDFF